MRPLTLDDLLPLAEYAARRREFFESQARYRDQYRRVRIGPRLTLLFENRQTLWFRVQELLRIARLSEPALVQRELDAYNRLLPSRNLLQAALRIEVADETRLVEELVPWQHFQGEALILHVGVRAYPARLVTCRPEDRAIGTAHWVQFAIDEEGRLLLAESRCPAHFQVAHAGYQHESAALSDEVRQSLLEDLTLSDRDERGRAGMA
jgi:hypothetical protein